MSSSVRRAVGFAVIGTFTLLVPVLFQWDPLPVSIVSAIGHQWAMTTVLILPFLLLTVVGLLTREGSLFDLFAFPGDRKEERLYGLASFCLSLAGLIVISFQFGMGIGISIASVFILVYGNLAQKVTANWTDGTFALTAVFVIVGSLFGVLGQQATTLITGRVVSLGLSVFLAASGALLGALLRSVLFDRDDPLVLLSIALVLWLFTDLSGELHISRVLIALFLTIGFGYLSYALKTASVTGMLAGVLLALLTVVFGGYGWFVILITFFGVGGLSSKFRYEEKRSRGLAQDNEGQRGSGNVIANSAIALIAVLGSATGSGTTLFLFAFCGAIATAMSDTLSSEIGGLYDSPRLITTMQPVPPGTDGGITWQGECAGLLGAVLIGGLAAGLFGLAPLGGAIIVLAGICGMTADSVLGATLEGKLLDNMAVNFFATLIAALIAVGLTVTISMGV